MPQRHPLVLAVIYAIALLPVVALADTRPFTFVYDSSVMARGTVEHEQWVTWKTNKGTDRSFDRFDFRHEIEMGITDSFQLAFYVSDWRYEDGARVADDGATWRNVAVEGIYNLTNAVSDSFGSALYGEIKIGDELAVLEGKLLVDKQVGDWLIAWNGIIEVEWEGEDFIEDIGVFGNTFGVSYRFNPNLRLGAELIHEIEYADWSSWGDHVVYLGPNLSYQRGSWWFAVTPVFQITDVDSEANYMTRLLFGLNF